MAALVFSSFGSASASVCSCVKQWVISCPYRPGHSPWAHWMLWNVESVWKLVKASFHDASVSWAALNSAQLFTPQEGKRQNCSPGWDGEHNDRQQTQQKKSTSSVDVVDRLLVVVCIIIPFGDAVVQKLCILALRFWKRKKKKPAFTTHCGVFLNASLLNENEWWFLCFITMY